MSRTIRTTAELDALPVGSVIGFAIDGSPRVMVQVAPGEWESTSGARWTSDRLASHPPAPLTVLHDPSALSMSTENAIAALSEWGVGEGDAAAIREAVVEAAAWKLIDRTSDLADRGPSDEIIQAALTAARAALPHLTAAPSATREEVADVLVMTRLSDYAGTDVAVIDQAADALLARFNITERGDR